MKLKTLLVLLFFTVSLFGAFPNGYDKRIAYTIAASQITGTVTGLTWTINGTYADLAITGSGGFVTDAQGDDVIYTESDGTTAIPYCREIWTSTTGRIVDHIKPASSTVGTVIYQYFGNSGVTTDQSDCANTWRSTFKEVWPLGDGTTLSGASPVTGGHTMTGNNSPTAVAGQIDGGVGLNGTTQTMTTSAFTLNATPNVFTWSAWTKLTSLAGRNTVFTTTTANAAQHWWIEVGTHLLTNSVEINYNTLVVFLSGGSTYPNDGAFHHLAFSRNGTGNTGVLYIDGASTALTYAADLGFLDSSVAKSIGQRNATQFFGGSIDMVTYADTVRSADEIAAEFKSGFPLTFYSVGSTETGNSRRRITVVN